jgi:hypothetical protein
MIAVGIITAPRARPTLARSVASLRAAGFKCPVHIFCEPITREEDFLNVVAFEGLMAYENPTRLGNFRNWVHALGQMLITNATWIMICEDDIQWAQGAAEDLEFDLLNWKHPDAGAISLYLPIRMSKVLEQTNRVPLSRGYHALNLGRKTWGAQCLVFRRAWAEALLQDRVLLDYLADPKLDKNVDAHVAETLVRRGRQIMWRVPCLVEHTLGDGNSSLGYKDDRPELRTKYFKGAAA